MSDDFNVGWDRQIRADFELTLPNLQHQLLEIIDSSRTLELSLFDAFGETEDTFPVLYELQSITQ